MGKEIQSWQSVHCPYKTAAEIGLPEEEPRIEPWLPLKQPVLLAAFSNSIASSPEQRSSREWTTSQTSPEK